MNINLTTEQSQLLGSLVNELLTQIRGRSVPIHQTHRRQNWRFEPPTPRPQVQAYWSDLWQKEIAALDADWSSQRETTSIITDTAAAPEGDHVSIQQAS